MLRRLCLLGFVLIILLSAMTLPAFAEENILLISPRPQKTGTFADVFESDFFFDAVDWAVDEEITAGVGDNIFGPDEACTRAQAVTFLWRMAGSPTPHSGVMAFDDVAADAYYYDAVLWAVEQGITSGTGAETFSPDAVCSRGQIVTFLWRMQKVNVVQAGNPFLDVADNSYCFPAVQWAVEQGVTAGTGGGYFSPDAACTRGQIVTFLYRFSVK